MYVCNTIVAMTGHSTKLKNGLIHLGTAMLSSTNRHAVYKPSAVTNNPLPFMQFQLK